MPGSIITLVNSLTLGLGVLTSMSISWCAICLPDFTVTFTFPFPTFSTTFSSKFTSLSPISSNFIFCISEPLTENSSFAWIETVTFLTLLSIAKTVTGICTFSEGLTILGRVDKTIRGFLTGVVSSIDPYEPLSPAITIVLKDPT